MATHLPPEALKRESSLSGTKRLNRRWASTTRPVAQSSRPRSRPNPNRWHWLPMARKDRRSTPEPGRALQPSGDIGGGGRGQVGGAPRDRRLEGGGGVPEMSGHVPRREGDDAEGQRGGGSLEQQRAHRLRPQKVVTGSRTNPRRSKVPPRISLGSAPR